MAEETKKVEASAAEAEVVVPEAEKPAAAAEKPVEAAEKAVPAAAEAEKPAEAEKVEEKKIAQQVSFKEETNVVSELPESQRKALEDLKKLIQESLEKHDFSSPAPAPAPAPAPKAEEQPPSEEKPAKEAASAPVAEAPKTDEASATAEIPSDAPKKTDETPKTEESQVKTEEPQTKTEEPQKKAEEPQVKTEEPQKKTEEPQVKTEEPQKKTEEPQVKTEETKEKAEEPQKKPEEVKKEEEDIKETIVVEVATPAAPEAVAEEPPKEVKVEVPEVPKEPEEVSIWGIPLLADERSDVILLKFLRARDFRVKDAFIMIRNTVRWRKEFDVDALLEEDLGSDYDKVVFTHGVDKLNRPVCYNVFGEFQNKELYQNTFSDAEKRKKFLRWLIQFLEKTIRTLDFSPTGINSFVLVNDLKNSPGYGKRDLYKVIDKFLEILQDNYPEFAAKQLCINVSWWYLAYNWIYLTVFTPRSKSKFVFSSPSKTAETLFKYIAPEQVPVQFGGHSKFGEHEFSTADPVTEITIKPGTKHPIEFAFSEESEFLWELRVIGWDVSYGAEFMPEKEGGYTLNITKPKKVTPTDEPVICDSFIVTEPGKVVITVDNQSSKKKKLLYRSKVKASQ